MISLIIQGPLNSRGFDAVENVKNIIDTFSSQPFLDKIVISTWSANDYNFGNEKVVYLENIDPKFKDFMNRYKQFVSVYNASLYIKNNVKSKYVLKVRSDQILDSNILDYTVKYLENSRYCSKNVQKQENFIITSHSYNCIPYFLGDFYFAGTTNDILSFTGTYAKYKGFCHQWLPEVDITLKYLYENDAKIPLHLFNIRSRGDIPQSSKKEWLEIYTQNFSVFPQKFFESLLWRGKPYSNEKHDYLEEWEKLKESPEDYKWHDDSTIYTLKQRLRDVFDYFNRRLSIIYLKNIKQKL